MKIIHLKSDYDHNNINIIKNHIVSKPCLVFIVAPWCEFCQKLQPTINTLENELVKEPEFKRVSLITVHDDQLKHINQKVKSFPTIRMFVKGRYIPDYSNEFKREANDIRNYIRKHMKNKKKTKKNVKTKKNKSKRPIKTFNIFRSKRKNKKGGNGDKSYKRKFGDNITNIPNRSRKKLQTEDQKIQIYVAPHIDINSDWKVAEDYAIEVMNAIRLDSFEGVFPIVDAIDQEKGVLKEIKRIKKYKKINFIHTLISPYTSSQQWNELVKNKIGGEFCMIFEGKYSLLNDLEEQFRYKGSKVKIPIYYQGFSPESEDLVVFIVCIPAKSDPDS